MLLTYHLKRMIFQVIGLTFETFPGFQFSENLDSSGFVSPNSTFYLMFDFKICCRHILLKNKSTFI